jgi:hypothetical protein
MTAANTCASGCCSALQRTDHFVSLTVCTKDRKRILASADLADAIVRAWNAARSWRVGRYIIMPDHNHPLSYVLNNAVRARLVTDPEHWPFQGEINILRWS